MAKKNEVYQKPRQPLAEISFYYYGVNVDYDSNRSGCTCDDYACRCSRIVNAHVTKVDLPSVGERISVERKTKNEIDLYCIDRVLAAYKIYDKDFWNIKICNGYYGQEIDSVKLDPTRANKIDAELDRILGLKSTTEKIEALLTLEYGYVLDALFNCEYEIKEIDKTDIKFQREHYTKLDQSVIESYKKYDLPRGIVVAERDKYRLIDGYHRVSAADETVKILVATKRK